MVTVEKLSDPKIKKDFDIRVQKYYNLYYEEFEDDEKEPSKERIDMFKESVNNDLKKFFYNIRIDVKNNHETIKNNLLVQNVKKNKIILDEKKPRDRPKIKN